MSLGLNGLKYLGAITAQAGPVYKGLMQKGLGAIVRLGAGSYTIAPDGATPIPLVTSAQLDSVPAISLLSTTANINGGITTAAGPLLQCELAVAGAATDIDFVVFGLSVN